MEVKRVPSNSLSNCNLNVTWRHYQSVTGLKLMRLPSYGQCLYIEHQRPSAFSTTATAPLFEVFTVLHQTRVLHIYIPWRKGGPAIIGLTVGLRVLISFGPPRHLVRSFIHQPQDAPNRVTGSPEGDVYKLSQTVRKYNLNSSKTKLMAFAGDEPVRAKVIVDVRIMKQDSTFKVVKYRIGLREMWYYKVRRCPRKHKVMVIPPTLEP
jgi:hypothetical protein